MRKAMATLGIIAAFTFWTACGNKNKTQDSKEAAKDQNEQKFEHSDIEKDAEWAVWAADAGMFEVKLSQLAEKNAMSQSVKDFAKMMVEDHSKANDELMAWAKTKNVSLPATMSDKMMEKYNDLATKTGMDFDKDYMDMMVDGHEKAVDKFKDEADNGKDADLKTWASGKLPTLSHHLEVAKTTRDAVKDMKKDMKKK